MKLLSFPENQDEFNFALFHFLAANRCREMTQDSSVIMRFILWRQFHFGGDVNLWCLFNEELKYFCQNVRGLWSSISFPSAALTFFHGVSSLGWPTCEPPDAADNEDMSDLSKCHKEFQVGLVGPRGSSWSSACWQRSSNRNRKSRGMCLGDRDVTHDEWTSRRGNIHTSIWHLPWENKVICHHFTWDLFDKKEIKSGSPVT